MLAVSEKVRIFAPVKRKGRVAQLNRVADYGSAGYRFESCRDHRGPLQSICRGFLFFCTETSGQFENLGEFRGQRNNLRDFIFKHII